MWCRILSYINDAGFTSFHATLNEACPEENVTFFCATSYYRLRWSVAFNDRGVLPQSYLLLSGDSAGRSHSVTTTNGVRLHFELLSNSMGILNSTLRVQTTTALSNANIKCEGTAVRNHRFILAGILCNNTSTIATCIYCLYVLIHLLR